MNRVALLQILDPLIDPTPTQKEGHRKSLDKLLVDYALTLPFERAHKLANAQKAELEVVLRQMFVAKDIQKLAAAWEPKRKLDAELKENLRDDLVDLLHARRALYSEPQILDLPAARGAGETYRHYIERILPTGEAKKLLKLWDRRIKVPKTREEIIERLLRMLDGVSKNSTSLVA